MQAIIFDFDGLILDTEVPDFQSWQEIYQVYGDELTLSTWLPYIGAGSSSSPFNIYDHLEEQIGRELNREEVRALRRRRYAELVAAQPLLPGVEAVIAEARGRGLQLAVASSAEREWVVGHLTQRNLAAHFAYIVCGDEVATPTRDAGKLRLYTRDPDAGKLRLVSPITGFGCQSSVGHS